MLEYYKQMREIYTVMRNLTVGNYIFSFPYLVL